MERRPALGLTAGLATNGNTPLQADQRFPRRSLEFQAMSEEVDGGRYWD